MGVHVVTARLSELGFLRTPFIAEGGTTLSVAATITVACAVCTLALVLLSKRPRNPDASLAPGAVPLLGHTIAILKNYGR